MCLWLFSSTRAVRKVCGHYELDFKYGAIQFSVEQQFEAISSEYFDKNICKIEQQYVIYRLYLNCTHHHVWHIIKCTKLHFYTPAFMLRGIYSFRLSIYPFVLPYVKVSQVGYISSTTHQKAFVFQVSFTKAVHKLFSDNPRTFNLIVVACSGPVYIVLIDRGSYTSGHFV